MVKSGHWSVSLRPGAFDVLDNFLSASSDPTGSGVSTAGSLVYNNQDNVDKVNYVRKVDTHTRGVNSEIRVVISSALPKEGSLYEYLYI